MEQTTTGNQFKDVIRTADELRRVIKAPGPRVANKVIDHIDDICARYIAASPFVVVATSGADGHIDLSPKGDPPGFVHILESKTLAIPDRLGNNRVDTLCNLIDVPQIGLIFLIPGSKEILRVSGAAAIVRDQDLRDRLAHDGKAPNLAIVVTVKRAFFHCAKCLIRSAMWSPENWPDTSNVATLAEAMVAHGRLSEPRAEMQRIIDNDEVERLY